MMNTYAPFSSPYYLLVKPVGPACNLRCTYCYYLEKKSLFKSGDAAATPAAPAVMSDDLLEKFIKEYIEAQPTDEVMFTWHGGEPTLLPVSYYEKVVRLQQRYAQGRRIFNSLQTNGTLITKEWCQFFFRNHFLVGVSIDGPADYHDPYRRTPTGKGSFDAVMKGILLLNRYHVEWNALAVVNDRNVNHPLEFYNFFKHIHCHYIQFTPVVERRVTRDDGLTLAPGMTEGGEVTRFSVTAEAWGRFLCAIFDEWVRKDVGQYYVQLFDATLANWVGTTPGLCTLARDCGHAGALEHNGDVYACDHFVYPEYLLGNLRHDTMTQIINNPRRLRFKQIKQQWLPRQCRECRYLFACNGECPRNRFVQDRYGEPYLNYLCAGYYRFFDHVAPYMEFMKRELSANRPPANIMEAIRMSEGR